VKMCLMMDVLFRKSLQFQSYVRVENIQPLLKSLKLFK